MRAAPTQAIFLLIFFAVSRVMALKSARSTHRAWESRSGPKIALKGSYTYESASDLEVVLPEYDGDEIDRFYSRRPLEVWERLVDIGSPVLGWWLARSFDKATSFMRTEEEREMIIE